MSKKHSHIRLSWYLPLPELITHKRWLKKSSLWLNNFDSNLQKIKSYSLIIPNVGQLAYETRFCYPLMRKYQQLNLQVDFDFAPVFFASTPQFKRCFVVKTSTAEDKTLLRNVRSIAFSIKCFPAGFVVFNSYMNLNEWNTQPLNHKLLNKILCGK